MLKFFRRKKSSLQWVLWLVIIVLAAGMVLLFVNPPSDTGEVAGSDVASVAGSGITIQEFRRQYGQLLQLYQQQFGDQFEQFRDQMRLGEQALNGLISEYAVTYEAKRIGLLATPDEISERITSYPVFHEEDTGRFVGVTRYQQILASNNMTPVNFEASISRQILREKLMGLLGEGIEPSPEEIRQEFANQNQQVKIAYAYLDPETIKTDEIDDEKLQLFYEENSAAYTIPEKRKLQYLVLPISPEAVELQESEIKSRMAGIPLEQRVRASHILFSVPPEGETTEARRKATQVLRQIRNGADFAEMARQHSEDARTAADGDLGFFGRGQMVPEFENVAFSLKEGEVSDLVETPFGIHIIKVITSPGTPEASQRASAEFELGRELAQKAAESRAESLLAELKAGAALEAIGTREGLAVEESPLMTLMDPAPDMGTLPDFNQQVFALAEGEYVGPYAGTEGVIIGMLDEIQPATLQELDAVREQATADYKETRRGDLAIEGAKNLYRAALDSGSLEEAAKSQGLEVVTTDFFAKGATVDDIVKFSPILHDRAFTLETGKVSPPVPIAGKQIVFQVLEKTELDLEEFEKTKGEIAQRLRDGQRNAFVTGYIQNVIDQLRKDEAITVNQELLDAITS